MSDAQILAAETQESPKGALGPVRGLLILIIVFFGAVLLTATVLLRDVQPSTSHYLFLSVAMFLIGAFGVMIRRNALVLFMCIELMLNAVNLSFAAFSRMFGGMDGQVAVLFVVVVAAAEVAVGLAIIVSIFRRRHSANVDDLSELKW